MFLSSERCVIMNQLIKWRMCPPQCCCPNCGQLRGPDAEARCAECGVDPASIPPPYGMSWSAVRRFMVAMAIGLVLGMAAAEAAIVVDERGRSTPDGNLGTTGASVAAGATARSTAGGGSSGRSGVSSWRLSDRRGGGQGKSGRC